MSSLRNAVKRKTHKERAQPAHRRRLGLLEKKSDYKLRANDHHSKQRRLRALHRRADFKNPDEFYFKMVSSKTNDGVHVSDREIDNVDAGVERLVRTQNVAYLRLHESAEARTVEQLRSSLHFVDSAAQYNSHTLFLDDEEEAAEFDKAEHFGTTEEFEDRAFNRPLREAVQSGSLLASGDAASVKRDEERRNKSYKELSQRLTRQDKIRTTLDHMQLHKNLSGKGRRSKVQDAASGRPAVYKWRQERKR